MRVNDEPQMQWASTYEAQTKHAKSMLYTYSLRSARVGGDNGHDSSRMFSRNTSSATSSSESDMLLDDDWGRQASDS